MPINLFGEIVAAASGSALTRCLGSPPARLPPIAAPKKIPIVFVVPEGVKQAFNSLPKKLSDQKILALYTAFQKRVKEITEPTVDHYWTTGLARSIIYAPDGLAYALMNRVPHHDQAIDVGGFKEVWHAVGLHDGKRYAIGICDIAKAALKKKDHSEDYLRGELAHEAQMAQKMSSIPGCVETPVAFENEGFYYFVMNYCPSSLHRLEKNLIAGKMTVPLELRVRLCREIAEALLHLHDREIIHRDVKGRNVLVNDEGGPVLCDFGYATFVTDDSTFGMRLHAGTVQYRAPEIHRHERPTYKSDVWSAGIIFFHLLLLYRLPWENFKDIKSVKNGIPHDDSWKAPVQFALPSALPAQGDEIKKLLSEMVCVSVKNRLTMLQTCKRLKAIEEALKTPQLHRKPGKLEPLQKNTEMKQPTRDFLEVKAHGAASQDYSKSKPSYTSGAVSSISSKV